MLVTILMLIAAGTAIAGFGVLFTMWWNSSVSDPREVLRIASQEYVAGRPVVAGELAMTRGAVYVARSRVIAKLRKEIQARMSETSSFGNLSTENEK